MEQEEFQRLVIAELGNISHALRILLNQQRRLMSQVTDLDQAVTDETAALTTSTDAITKALTDLEAKVAAAGTPVDLTAEIATIREHTAALTTLGTTAAAADPGT